LPRSGGALFLGTGNKSPDWAAGALVENHRHEETSTHCRVRQLTMRAFDTHVNSGAGLGC
jgi:hypothetical protein